MIDSTESPEDRSKGLKWGFDAYQGIFHILEKDLKEASILDVGAGDGEFVGYAREVLGNQNVFGVDKREYDSIPNGVIQADGVHLPFKDGQFKIVVACHYVPIETDIITPMMRVREMLRVMSDDGYVTFNGRTPEGEQAAKQWFIENNPEIDSEDKDRAIKKYDAFTNSARTFLQDVYALKEEGYEVTQTGEQGSVFTIRKKPSTE